MRARNFKSAMKQLSMLPLNQLRRQAARNKRLLVNALHCKFRRAYLLRKQLGRAYGREIARRMAK